MWALRVGYVGLAAALAGVVLMASSSVPHLLFAGVVTWLVAGAVAVAGVVEARRDLPEPQPGLWELRLLLVRDTVRARPAPAAS